MVTETEITVRRPSQHGRFLISLLLGRGGRTELKGRNRWEGNEARSKTWAALAGSVLGHLQDCVINYASDT